MEHILLIVSASFIALGFLGLAVYEFLRLGKARQVKVLKEWLLLAVIQAEKELGEGTGQVKLRYVYNMFIDKFKFLAKMISFEEFSKYVDEALVIMKQMIATNKNVEEYIIK